MPLHPITLIPLSFVHLLIPIVRFGLFCHDYNETHRFEFSNSRNHRVSCRVNEVNSRIELSIFCLLFSVHHTPKRPNDESSI